MKLALFVCLLVLSSCDKGLIPPPASTSATLSGSIHFVGVPKDSVQLLLVVLVPQSPPFLASTLLGGYLSGAILGYSLSSTTFHDTTYSIIVKPDSNYRYLAVAQKYGSDFTKDWHAIGFAHDTKDSATIFRLKPGEIRTGVDIVVRFDSLPRQPFIQ